MRSFFERGDWVILILGVGTIYTFDQKPQPSLNSLDISESNNSREKTTLGFQGKAV